MNKENVGLCRFLHVFFSVKIVIKTIATNERLIVFNESINIQNYKNNISFLLSQDDSPFY